MLIWCLFGFHESSYAYVLHCAPSTLSVCLASRFYIYGKEGRKGKGLTCSRVGRYSSFHIPHIFADAGSDAAQLPLLTSFTPPVKAHELSDNLPKTVGMLVGAAL